MIPLSSRLLPSCFLTLLLPLLAGATPASVSPSWKIVVDASPFPSAAVAAFAEDEVDWSGADTRRQNASTLGYAAVELRAFLRRMAGVDTASAGFEIVPLDGTLPERSIILSTLPEARAHPEINSLLTGLLTPETVLPESGYALLPGPDHLLILGSDRAGALHGTYAFLHSAGARWYGPEAHEWHLPETDIHLPEGPVVESPDFATRGFWVRQDRGNEPFYLWMARNRMNFWSIAEPDRPLLHKLGIHLTYGGHEHFLRFMNPADPYPYDHPLYSGDEDKPADPAAANPDDFRGDADGDGVLSLFEARPEWYGLIDGVRTPLEGYLKTANVCTSNEAAMSHLYEGIIRDLSVGEWQDVASLNFWPVDMGDWCECAACQPLGTPTDRLMLMVNGLNRAIDAARADGRIHREIKIVFPIYLETLTAPTRPLPPDFDYGSIIGTFFPIHRCYVHSIDDPTCTEYNEEHWNAFLDWTEREPRHYKGELFVGEYFNVSVNKSLPVLYSGIIASDLQKYHRKGARHMHYMHTDTRLLGMKRLNNFLFASGLWDTEADFGQLKAGYFNDLYGPVAGSMEELYMHLEFGLSNIKQFRYWHHLPERITEGTDPLFHTDHFQLEESHPPLNDGVDLSQSVQALRTCRAIMDRLLSMELPLDLQTRLLVDDRNLRYGENTVFFYDALARAVLAERNGNLALARKEFIRSLPFARALKAEQAVVKTATNHYVHAEDGLDATRVEEAYMEMGERLFPGFQL